MDTLYALGEHTISFGPPRGWGGSSSHSSRFWKPLEHPTEGADAVVGLFSVSMKQ